MSATCFLVLNRTLSNILLFSLLREENDELSNDREELKVINQDLQNSIIQTQNANNSLKRELIELQENSIDRDTMQHELDTMQHELDTLQGEKEKLETFFNNQLNELQINLAQKEETINEMSETIKSLESKASDSSKVKAEESWETRLSQRFNDLDSLEAELDSISLLHGELDSKNNEIVLLEKTIEELSRNETTDRETITDPDFLTQHEDALREKEALTLQVTELKEEQEKLAEAFREARGEISRYSNIQENFQNEGHEKEIRINKLRDEVAKLQENEQRGVDTLKAKEELIEELSRENDSLKEETMRLSMLSEEFSMLKDSLDESHNQLSEKSQQIEQLQRDYDLKENSFAVITGECSALNLTVEESKSEVEQLAKSCELIHGEKESLEQILEGVQQENARLSEELKGREMQCQSLHDTLEEKKQLVGSLNDSMVAKGDEDDASKSHLLKQLEDYKMANERSENELQSALNRLDEFEAVLMKKNADLKEKSEKASKLRNVALKAKKELENMRSKALEEKSTHEAKVVKLMEEVKHVQDELVLQKTTQSSKHEEELEVRK